MTITEFLAARLEEDEAAMRGLDETRPWMWVDHDAPESDEPLARFRDWALTPARVLAEVEAARQIMQFVGDEYPHVLRLLALPYADRPGYRPEWRPDGQNPRG